MRVDGTDPAGTWAWWGDTWGYLRGPWGLVALGLLAVAVWIAWADLRDTGEDDE
jgi:hypothetical protein